MSTLPVALRGALWMVGALVSFSVMAVSVRELLHTMGSFEILFIRSLMSLLILLFLLPGRVAALRTRHFGLHVLRNCFHFGGQLALVYAISLLPLAITVLVVQNGQGITVLRSAAHTPPVDAITIACGGGTVVTAFLGAVPTCLTGPVNAILSSSGEKKRQYTAGIFVGVLALAFGLFAPVFTRLMLGTPKAFISALAGLAMLRVLQTAFTVSFRDRFALGALVTFLVTVADVPILNVGAPFWGLVFGYAASRLLARGDFAIKA